MMNGYAFHLAAALILVVMGTVCLSACVLRPDWFVKYAKIRGKYWGADQRFTYALVAIFFIVGGIMFFFSK